MRLIVKVQIDGIRANFIHVYSACENLHTPSFFSRFVILQPYVKLLWIIFFHINLHSTHYNNKAKTELSQLAASSLFGYHMTRFAYQNFAIICHSSPLKVCQVGWGRRTFSGFFRNIWLGSSPGSGWSTQGHSQCCVYTILAVWMLWTGFSLRTSQYFAALGFCSTLMSPSVT